MQTIPVDIPARPPRSPAAKAPEGTTDCHFHIFGARDQYPLSPDRKYDPVEAGLPEYSKMAQALGIQRAVVVNASPYGFDNRCLVDAIRSFSIPARGVAVVRPDVSENELESLRVAGVRGIRVNAISGPSPSSHIIPLASKIEPFDMHLQLWIGSEYHAELLGQLQHVAVPIVIDHMGQIPAHAGLHSDHFQSLLSLLKSDRVWIKLIGYRVSSGPPYADIAPMAERIIDTAPHRCIWGTDWPHPFLQGRPMPDDADLFDLLRSWCDASQFRRILVDNPARLYGFDTVES